MWIFPFISGLNITSTCFGCWSPLKRAKLPLLTLIPGGFAKQEGHDSDFLLGYLSADREVWERERNISNSGPFVSFLLLEMIQQIQ